MTENTAGKLTRPAFDEAYENMTGLEDEAITEHLGHDVEELFERLNDGALSNRNWLELVGSLEFLILRKEHPEALAAQMIREMPRKDLGDRLEAWMRATFPNPEPADAVDPETPEGKGSSPSVTSASPATTPEPASDEPSSGNSA